MKEDCLTFGDSNNACYDQHAQNEIHCCKNHVMFQVSYSCSPAILVQQQKVQNSEVHFSVDDLFLSDKPWLS